MATHATVRFVAPKSATRTVLLIEDDAPVAGAMIRMMNAEGYQVVHVGRGGAAVEKVMNRCFDAVISDVSPAGTPGVDVLDVVRAYDPGIPLVLMTGTSNAHPTVDAANVGVLEYLAKPPTREQLVRVLGRATKVRRSMTHRREVRDDERHAMGVAATLRPDQETSEQKLTTPVSGPVSASGDVLEMVTSRVLRSNAETIPAPPSTATIQLTLMPRGEAASAARTSRIRANEAKKSIGADAWSEPPSSLHLTFDRAMSTLSVELEPIAEARSKKLLGFATRIFSGEETLGTESALVAAATQLGRLEHLRRRARDLAVKAFVDAPPDALLFVDIHPSDLLDGDLYSPEPPLARIADRVVLQVRADGLGVEDLSARASVLRFVGFRIAIADLDAGHAYLQQIADLSPEFVKIDARLVRGMIGSSGCRRLVAALVSMCAKLDAVSIPEGVSTAEECQALVDAGCAFVQGSLVVRHSAAVSSRRGARVASGR